MVRLYKLLFISLIATLMACAQVVAPTGGLKDVDSPEILESEPSNATTNFNASKIELKFNEYVRLNNLKEQLIVSPPLKYDLKTSIKGKSLHIEIKDTLSENTTYVLNFGNSIVDITEGNPIKNFQYVFATGNEIDSLQFSGKILDAFSLKIEKDVLVMLYESSTAVDSTPMLQLPNYIGRTNKDGEYNITNIKSGNYKLFALADANNNYLFDRPDEKIAFLQRNIEVVENIENINLFTFQESNETQFIEKQSEKGSQLILDFKLATTNLQYSGIDTNLNNILLLTHQNPAKDSIHFWWKEMENTRIKIAIKDDTLFSDTIKVKIDSLRKTDVLKLASSFKSKQNFYQAIPLKFNRPIKAFDTSKITVFGPDSSSIPFSLSPDSIHKQLFYLSFTFKEDSSYALQILPESFTDIYNRTIDTISSLFSFNKAEDFGRLTIKLNSPETSNKILQLSNAKGSILSEQKITGEQTEFNYLKAGSYKLKIIFDSDNNNQWTTGKYLLEQQAERTVIFDEPISIRENWDKEIEWIIK